MKIISYGRQCIDASDIREVIKVLKSDWLTQGPKIKEFEDALCKYTGAKYAVAVSSGTAALHIACLAVGIKRGDEVITSPITFVASANSILYCGGKPVFADIQKDTVNIDPEEIKKKISPNTKAIIPVHFAGQPCNMSDIKKITKENRLYVIEDAAHAIGSRYADGSTVGNCRYSDMTVFSFHPVKTITTGEGGAITTNDKILYEKLIMLRSHGITKDQSLLTKNPGPWYYEMQMLGFNYRITDIQATLGVSQLSKLDCFVKRRREIVGEYNKAFSDIPWIKTPFEEKNVYSAFHLYAALIDFEKLNLSRPQVMEKLKNNGIGTQVHYIPVYTQPYYKNNFDYKDGHCPVAEEYYKYTLSLPLYPSMSKKQVNHVISIVKGLINV
jgi:UDP-4-amino-4,6-dideoxy-N-acetyl-beta-L-altrosamine transaminase